MKRRPWLAALLSVLFPGLGQVYAGKRKLGAALMLGFIVVGNLNAIWLSVYAGAETDLSFYSDTLPRVLHDVFAFYAIGFWIWTVVDAYRLAKETQGAVKA